MGGAMSYTNRWMDAAGQNPEPEPAAFTNPETREIDDEWLAAAAADEQLKAMRLWFLARYCDPAEETPYVSDAGGYIFTRGGPHDPNDVLQERFDSVVAFETIRELVEELYGEVGDEWAPTALTAEDEWEDVFVDTASGPIKRLRERLDDLATLSQLDGPPMSRILQRQLVFAAIITALETYLWEMAVYWLANDSGALARLLEGVQQHQQRIAELGGDTPENRTKLRAEIESRLNHGTVWHRWAKNRPILQLILGVDMPPHEALEHPTRVRHDISHRGGKDTDHNPVNLSTEDVESLSLTIIGFAEALQQAVDGRGLEASASEVVRV